MDEEVKGMKSNLRLGNKGCHVLHAEVLRRLHARA